MTKSKQIKVYLNDIDYQKIKQIADDNKLKISEVCRNAITNKYKNYDNNSYYVLLAKLNSIYDLTLSLHQKINDINFICKALNNEKYKSIIDKETRQILKEILQMQKLYFSS